MALITERALGFAVGDSVHPACINDIDEPSATIDVWPSIYKTSNAICRFYNDICNYQLAKFSSGP